MEAVLLNTTDPAALNANDRLPPEVLRIGELTVIPPVPPPAPASSVSDTTFGFVNVISPSKPGKFAPKRMFPDCVPPELVVVTVTDVPEFSAELIVAGSIIEPLVI